MTAPRKVFACLLAIITACAAPELLAHMPGGGRSRGGDRNRGDAPMKGQRPAPQENAADLIEHRLQLLEDDLKLSPEQQGAWDSWAGKVKALVSDMSRERTRAQAGAQMSAPQQADHAVDVACDRRTAMEDIAAAAKTLYGGLTPQQKSLAAARLG